MIWNKHNIGRVNSEFNFFSKMVSKHTALNGKLREFFSHNFLTLNTCIGGSSPIILIKSVSWLRTTFKERTLCLTTFTWEYQRVELFINFPDSPEFG